MEESNYIFESSDSLYTFGIILSCILLFVAIFYLIKLINNYKDKKDRTTYLTYVGITLIFLLMIYHGTSSDRNYFEEIKDHLGVTDGTTLLHEVGDGYNHITYEFQVNGKWYEGQSGMTYNGQTVSDIKVPNGKYKVLYNIQNPNMSVMDFKVRR